MARILVLYDSVYGQTKKIAEYIGSVLKKKNNFVEVINVSLYPKDVSPQMYDGIILGGPVHAGKYPAKLIEWAKEHATILNKKPSAFFSVCLGILQPDPRVQKEEQDIATSFFYQSGWRPRKWSIFAGALAYSQYSFFTKWMMRFISRKAGGATDTGLDHEYTDWEQVRRYTNEFCQLVTAQKPEMPNWQT